MNDDIRLIVREWCRDKALQRLGGDYETSIYFYLGEKTDEQARLREYVSKFTVDTLAKTPPVDKIINIEYTGGEINAFDEIEKSIETFKNRNLFGGLANSKIHVYIITDMNDRIFDSLNTDKLINELKDIQEREKEIGLSINYICTAIVNMSRVLSKDEKRTGRRSREFLCRFAAELSNKSIIHIPRMMNDLDMFYTAKTIAFLSLMVSLKKTSNVITESKYEDGGYSWVTMSLSESSIRAFITYKLCTRMISAHMRNNKKGSFSSNEVETAISDSLNKLCAKNTEMIMEGIYNNSAAGIPLLISSATVKERKRIAFITIKETERTIQKIEDRDILTALNDLEAAHRAVIEEKSNKYIDEDKIRGIVYELVGKCETFDDIDHISKIIEDKIAAVRKSDRGMSAGIRKYEEYYSYVIEKLKLDTNINFLEKLHAYISDEAIRERIKNDVNRHDMKLHNIIENAMGSVFKNINADDYAVAIDKPSPLMSGITDILGCIDLKKMDHAIEDNAKFGKMVKDYTANIIEDTEAPIRSFNGKRIFSASMFKLYSDEPLQGVNGVDVVPDDMLFRQNIIQLMQVVQCTEEESKQLPYYLREED